MEEFSNYSNIPQQMKEEKRWLLFVIEERTEKDGSKKLSKRPVNGNNIHAPGKSNDPATWCDFQSAVKQIGKHTKAYGGNRIAGLGFALGDGWAGVDLDGGENHGGKEVPEELF